jgi:hypothetical protein
MDIKNTRASNLQRLINEYEDAPGNRAAFCRRFGLDPLQIGQYFTNSENGRNIGEKKARQIEELVGLTHGWLDQVEHDTTTPTTLHAIKEVRSAYAEDHQLIWATNEEQALLTQFRLGTVTSQELMMNFAKNAIKDPEKVKRLVKYTG